MIVRIPRACLIEIPTEANRTQGNGVTSNELPTFGTKYQRAKLLQKDLCVRSQQKWTF